MPSKRLLPTALAAAAFAVAALIPGMSSASAAVDHDPCVASPNHYCVGPRVTTGNQCPGDQSFAATDGYGVPMHWTYSGGNTSCVRVDYSYDVSVKTTKRCQFWFYVPAGHATAPVYIGYWIRPWSTKFSVKLDENAHEGWTHVFDAAQVYDIQFQDNNGTTAHAIGWGDGSRYGWSVWC